MRDGVAARAPNTNDLDYGPLALFSSISKFIMMTPHKSGIANHKIPQQPIFVNRLKAEADRGPQRV